MESRCDFSVVRFLRTALAKQARKRFLASPENWAERADQLGWDTMTLFACAPRRPLDYSGSAGLLWAVNGGNLVELHRDWAVIDVPVQMRQRIFYRRNVDQAKISLPWAKQTLARERAALEQLLVVESERAGIVSPTLAQKLATLVPLSDFLVAKVQTHGPMKKDQLRAEARLAGYFSHGDGRTFHITLMNVTKCRRLIWRQDGRYTCPEQQAMFNQSEEGKMQTLM